LREIADGIGFGIVFAYMGFAIDAHEPALPARAP
jgi:hypothetical protein